MPVSADRSRDGAWPACRAVGLGFVAAAVVAAALLPGCGPRRPTTFRVDGMLRDTSGVAIERASVTFLSDSDGPSDGAGKRYRAEGIVGEDGRFTLTTFQPGDGAVAGTHRVLIVPLPAGDGPTAFAPAIPARYEHPDHSGLVVEVEPKAVNEVILVIERGPARQPPGGG
jgi:hypothetical protein